MVRVALLLAPAALGEADQVAQVVAARMAEPMVAVVDNKLPAHLA